MTTHKSKTYVQDGPLWQGACLSFFACALGAFYFGIAILIGGISERFAGFHGAEDVVFFVILEIAFLVLLPFFAVKDLLVMESYNIHLDDGRVWMRGERTNENHRIQFDAAAPLADIVTISLFESSSNSRGRPIPEWPQCFAIKRYLSFRCRDGKDAQMNVTHYTKRHLERILQDVIAGMLAAGNDYKGPSPSGIIAAFRLRKRRRK